MARSIEIPKQERVETNEGGLEVKRKSAAALRWQEYGVFILLESLSPFLSLANPRWLALDDAWASPAR